MNARKFALTLAAAFALGGATLPNAFAAGQNGDMSKMQQPAGDPRKATTLQRVSLDAGSTKNAIEVQYLNLPWGAATFGYMEQGGNEYYSTRTWPIAHLRLAKAAMYRGTSLTPGDYVLYITPKSASSEMTLTVASYKPATAGGTFLVPGNVFVATPADVKPVVTQPVVFAKGAPVANALMIDVAKSAKGADVTMHYGDRTLTESFEMK